MIILTARLALPIFELHITGITQHCSFVSGVFAATQLCELAQGPQRDPPSQWEAALRMLRTGFIQMGSQEMWTWALTLLLTSWVCGDHRPH